MRRARLRVMAVALAVCGALAAPACSGETDQPPGTVGKVPEPSGPDTLLPVIPDTGPVDVSTTLPPDVLFGADMCLALDAADFAAVRFGSSGTGRLVGTVRVSEDSCQFDLVAGGTNYSVLVRARSQPDFVSPSEGDEEVEDLDGPGLAARGVQFADRYSLTVKVENGYFAVEAPTRDAALALAERAVPRADDPPPPSTSTTVPPTTPATVPPTTVPPSKVPPTTEDVAP